MLDAFSNHASPRGNGIIPAEQNQLNGHIATNGSAPGSCALDALTLEKFSKIQASLSLFSSDDEKEETVDVKVLERLPNSSLPSGVCYDSRMRFHTELVPSKDRSEYHPEDPRRIYFIYRALCEAGLIKDKMTIPPLVAQPLLQIQARHAKKAEVCLVHTPEHFEYLQETAGMSSESRSCD